MSIKENIKQIKKELPKNIIIVAATKTRSVDEIKQAIEAGIDIIGENYIQEAEAKSNELKGKVKLHCIGHIQTNKAKKAVEIFDMIETVDSIKLAKEIGKRCQSLNKIMPILIEINSGKEPNKDGVMPEDAEQLIRDISTLKNIKVKGLMTMAPFFDNPEKDRPYFKLTKTLFDKIKALNPPNIDMEILSMGMSDSYKIAVEEGANMVRIGAKIFGKR
ncbi:MAG: YggS family pyridoxal phosphate-dependent enzyme [Nanoarchaeota archaeon]|nr:YggS family pyridoxal phosphate-dependent enzyme [Nanoarchaeota archaeon]MBU1946600.1 YggS family pyridoxal phosphate-dependent enzyme [Nanoarchaeota archaeon]